MRRFPVLLLALFLGVASASAQDVLTIGSGSAPSGGVASIPVSIRDVTGTALGTDAGAGNRIQAFAFKVMFPSEFVSSVTFARAGVLASLTPLYESALQGNGWSAYVVAFSQASNAIPFTANTNDLVGNLTVTLTPQATTGSSIALRFDAPGAILSNQASTVRETVALGNLALVNGSVTVTVDAPANVIATATSTTQVDVTWSAVANAHHYEVWRSVDNSAYALAGSPTVAAYSDTSVLAGKTYLYHVLAVDAVGGMSPFSNIDPATTIDFADDPLIPSTTIVKVVHLTELRAAINAFRVSAGLAPLASDPTVAGGAVVRATHITDLRTALDAARSTLGLGALAYTDPTLTAGTTRIKAAHVQELRAGVE
jgi:hypothetical protein